MKKALIIFVTAILCMLFATLGASASSNIDNEKYIPKVITTDNGYKMIFDSELARIARRMASDSYGIAIDSDVQDISKTFQEEDFEDIKQSHLFDEPFMGAFSNNFLVGVKTFEVDGVEKHVLAIAFRGTQVKDGFDYADLFTDASVLGLNGFHSGFYAAALKAYDTLYDMEFPSLKNEDGSSMTFSDYLAHSGVVGSDYSILVTGHSLGGAVANIFAGDIISQFGKSNVMCYTFASPIVCSPTKAKEYDAYNIFNIINTNDIVPNVGYNLFAGVRLGNDLKVSVTDSEESAHSLSVTYEKATNQVINKVDSLYPYIHRTCITTVTNDVESTKDEIHIHADCLLEKRRFLSYIGNSDLLVKGDVIINADISTTGNLTIDSFAALEIRTSKLRIGDFTVNGAFMMTDDAGYIVVNGDCYANTYILSSTTGNVTEITAGTIEIKGDMINSGGYRASGTHKTILSGNSGQKIDLYNSGSSQGNFNILEVTNTSEEGVEFIERAYVYGELHSSDNSKIINGKNLYISGDAPIREIWNGDLSAYGWICEQECTINGDLEILFHSSRTLLNADVKVKGSVLIEGALEIGVSQLEIGEDFTVNDALVMTNDEGYILVNGDCHANTYILGSSLGNVTEITAGTVEIKGDMVNSGGYRASGTHKTILSGSSGQKIDLYKSGFSEGNFNILEVANTSEEGVEFVERAYVTGDILQPFGTNLININCVKLQGETAFVDYGELNSQINSCNGNAENVIPTWLDYERYCKFALDGDKVFTLNETITDTVFTCDLYFSNDYNKSSAVVIIAFYDGDNRFVQMASQPVNVKTDCSIEFEDKDYSKFKVMIWESFENLIPLSSVYEF